MCKVTKPKLVSKPRETADPTVTSHNASAKRIKLRHVVPSLVTVFAICSGLTSVRMSIEGNMQAALYLIVLAVFLDAADGKLARRPSDPRRRQSQSHGAVPHGPANAGRRG